MSSSWKISTSKILAVLAVLLLLAGNAFAGRKRLVVLDFDGPKGDKFHEDLVKLLKKNHTVVSVDKWNAKAEELDAAKVTEKNVKKLAKKLKIDGVITGKVEKRRDEYIIRLKLRAGTTGEILGNSVQTKADGPRLDGQAQRDIKEELIGAIDELESNHEGGGDDEEEDVPTKKADDEGSEDGGHKSGFSKKHDMDDESSKKDDEKAEKADKKKKDEEAKADKKKKDDDEKADKKKKDDDEVAEEETHSKKRDREESEDRPKKKKASRDEEGDSESVEESAEVEDVDAALKVAPSRRAIDAVVGLSFTARNLTFTSSPDLAKTPPGYKQGVPVAGALVDITAYPMSFNHQPKGIISGIGLNIVYDQVLKINSQKKYPNAMGMQEIADLKTAENRWSVGGVLRYPLGTAANSIVVGGTLSYGKQKFTVEQEIPNSGMPLQKTDIPNVQYTMISPGVFIQAPVIPKVVLNASAQFHLVTNTGDIQTSAQYGAATVTGFEMIAGADYMLMKNVFIRAGFRYERIGFKFKGDPMSQTNTRDADPEQDVQGAKDSYLGGAATIGYVY